MSDVMTFPKTVEEFMEMYKVVDTEGIYMSKGAELVPIFRMRQWFEHLPSADVAPVLRRQHIIIKVNRFVPSSEVQRVKQDVMHQLESDGVAVVDCGVEVITVDADVLAVE